MLSRIQFLIMALIVVSTMVGYLVILQTMLNSNLPLRWPLFFWFFGSVAAYAVMHYSYLLVCRIGKKRHATLNNETNEMYASLRDFFH